MFDRTGHLVGKRERFINDMLASMSVAEQLGQLITIEADIDLADLVGLANRIRRDRIGGIKLVRAAAHHAPVLSALQRVSVQETRLGIPLAIAFDASHGVLTKFPDLMGLAATWDPRLVENAMRIIALEAASIGINRLELGETRLSNLEPLLQRHMVRAIERGLGQFVAPLGGDDRIIVTNLCERLGSPAGVRRDFTIADALLRLRQGAATRTEVERGVRAVLGGKDAGGLFEQPHRKLPIPANLKDVGREIAVECFKRSIVLLKNDEGLLPLAREYGIAIFELHATTVGNDLTKRLDQQGFGVRRLMVEPSETSLSNSRKGLAISTRQPAANEITLLLVSGPTISLPERWMLAQLSTAGRKTCLVMMGELPPDCRGVEARATAIMFAPGRGEFAGSGIADLLTGRVPGSGQLPRIVHTDSGAWTPGHNCLRFRPTINSTRIRSTLTGFVLTVSIENRTHDTSHAVLSLFHTRTNKKDGKLIAFAPLTLIAKNQQTIDIEIEWRDLEQGERLDSAHAEGSWSSVAVGFGSSRSVGVELFVSAGRPKASSHPPAVGSSQNGRGQ